MSESNRESSTVVDTLKLMASVSILFASIVSFYYFSEISVLIRALVIIFSLVISLLIFFRTQRGLILWAFFQGSKVEMRKVVWPTREETAKTTGIIMIAVVVVAIFLWIIDAFFTWGVQSISLLNIF